MKKFFLIPLMALCTCVMAWGATRTAGTFAQLQDEIAAAAAGDVIELTADILDANALIDINKSITIDGKGFKLEGQGGNRVLTGLTDDKATEFYQQTLITLNNGYGVAGQAIPNPVSRIDVVLKNLAIKQTYAGNSSRSSVIITTYDYVKSLTLDNCTLDMTVTAGHNIAIAVWGTETDNNNLEFNLTNSILYGKGKSEGYPIIFMKPVDAYLENTSILGSYCNIYFKPPYSEMPTGNGYLRWKKGNSGSAGSVFTAKNSQFVSKNTAVSAASNGFATFVFEESGITLNLENCGMDAQQLGSANQNIFVFSEWAPISRLTQKVVINLSGDNTHFNGKFIRSQWYAGMAADGSFRLENGYKIQSNPTTSYDATKIFNKGNEAGTIRKDLVDFNITGGTYSINPSTYQYVSHLADKYFEANDEDFASNFSAALSGQNWGDADYYHDRAAIEKTYESPYIPAEYKVEEVKQGNVTLYRVVKKAAEKTPGVMYNLNDLVTGEGIEEGNNPVSSFDLSNGEDMTLNQEVTTAGYVQVKDHATEGATTVTVAQNVDPEHSQTLVINNGLDVQGASKVIVEPTAALVIGEGGINTENPENIVIEANEKGAASLLLDPTITVNQTPNLTVRMTAKQIGRDGKGDFYWHRFALPVAAGFTSWEKEGNLVPADPNYTVKYPTYLYAWDYANNDWANIAPNQMVPLQGYTLTLASDYIRVEGGKVVSEDTKNGNLTELQDVVYTFKGNLVGNEDQPLNFQHEGFNFFGNSYTGYMHVKTMLQGLVDAHIDGTAYLWCNDPANDAYQTYSGVSLHKLTSGKGLEDWQQEVAPMQTFILRLRGANSADEEVKYAASIWGNPRYGHSATSAPRRAIATIDDDTYMEIAVKAANGKASRVDFTESANTSDAFESGYDVEKYMNEKTINLYATVNGMNLSSVVTDNIEGKTLSLKTNGEIAYTMSFKNVEGAEYAIRDNATGAVIAIEEGATYEFAAQPNSTVEGRFEIVAAAKIPTSIDNTEVKANVKGIYTIMGQYLGENFDILPAGVYVVNGVKIVK